MKALITWEAIQIDRKTPNKVGTGKDGQMLRKRKKKTLKQSKLGLECPHWETLASVLQTPPSGGLSLYQVPSHILLHSSSTASPIERSTKLRPCRVESWISKQGRVHSHTELVFLTPTRIESRGPAHCPCDLCGLSETQNTSNED